MFLSDWWDAQRAKAREARAKAEMPIAPAVYGTATGEPTPHPWSAVVGAMQRMPAAVVNLDRLRRRVFELLGVPL